MSELKSSLFRQCVVYFVVGLNLCLSSFVYAANQVDCLRQFEDLQPQQLISYDFSESEQLNDWLVEGLGEIKWQNQSMVLEPEFYQDMLALYEKGVISNKNEASEFGPYLAKLVEQKHPELARKMSVKGVFRGGHFNVWNKHAAPDDFALCFDFKSLSSLPLHMLMFNSSGLNGESVFASHLAPRIGLAKEIMRGDVRQYRVSYFFPWRKTANLRKAPGRALIAQGPDFAGDYPNKWQPMVMIKKGGNIRFYINHKQVFSFNDEQPLPGGNWGFRLMVLGKGAYDNISLYRL